MYSKHPSLELTELFKSKPYQGQNPRRAKILFLGLDANFGANIATDGFFPRIKEYLSNGVKFWEKYGVHHPFLLHSYPSSDGVRYHRQFAKLGLGKEHAQYISFIELLDIPTTGSTTKNRKLFHSYLNLDYLRELDKLLSNNRKKLLFVSSGVLRAMQKIKREHQIFNWLPNNDIRGRNQIIKVVEKRGLQVYFITHFSASISNDHIRDMRALIDRFMEEAIQPKPEEKEPAPAPKISTDKEPIETLPQNRKKRKGLFRKMMDRVVGR